MPDRGRAAADDGRDDDLAGRRQAEMRGDRTATQPSAIISR